MVSPMVLRGGNLNLTLLSMLKMVVRRLKDFTISFQFIDLEDMVHQTLQMILQKFGKNKFHYMNETKTVQEFS